MKRFRITFGCMIFIALGFGHLQAAEISSRLAIPSVAVHADSAGNAHFSGPDLQYPGLAGEPAVPFKIVHLLLPSDADMASLALFVKESTYEPVPGQWSVSPVKPLTVRDGTNAISEWPSGKRIVDGKDQEIYLTNANYPANCIADFSPGKLRHWKLIEVPVALFQYNPVTRQLFRLTDIGIAVAFDQRSHAAPQLFRYDSNDLKSLNRVKRLAINFKAISSNNRVYTSTQSLLPAAPPTYAIITTASIVAESSELDNFVIHKQQRGFNVEVATEDEWGGGTGDTAADNIRSWLQTHYQSLNIEYVLLIGHPDPTGGDVPMKMLWPRSHSTIYRESPSDYYYADLTGNWDADGDGLFGEWGDDFGPGGVDRYWEVRVGRIPYYGDIDDLDHILAKLMQYQQETPASAAWRKRVLLPMEPSDGSTPGYPLGEAIKQKVLAAKCDWDYHRIYNHGYGLEPPAETIPCTVANVTAAWNETPAGAVFWWTHGSATSASNIMDVSHAAALDDGFPAFMFQASCLNASPENPGNLSYALLKNGGISTVGATRVSWYYAGQTVFANSPSNSGMTYAYASRVIKAEMDAGTALNDLKETISINSGSIWMNYTGFNIYGDPEIALTLPDETIIDDDDPGATAQGSWSPGSESGAHDGDARSSSEAGDRYAFEAQANGRQTVYIWWPADSDACTQVDVHIYDGDDYLDTIQIDQTRDRDRWNRLNSYRFSGTARVLVVAEGGCTTYADAVRFKPTCPLYVDSSRPVSGNGCGWQTAYRSIREAVEVAYPDGEIWVKKGTYRPGWPIRMNGIHLYGGFAGGETVRSARDWQRNATIIDGQTEHRLLEIDDRSTVDGVTLVGGYGPYDGTGSAMTIYSGRVENVAFLHNQHMAVGNLPGTGTGDYTVFHNCTFSENSATNWPASAMFIVGASTISNCVFEGNNSPTLKPAIKIGSQSDTRILNSIFVGNSGGAIVNSGDYSIVANCTIVGNTPFGIENQNGRQWIGSSILWDNLEQLIGFGTTRMEVRHCNIDQAGLSGRDGNIRQAPRFVSAAESDFRLSAASPCIDTGGDSAAGYAFTDVQGTPRLMDGDGDGNATADMGAFETFFSATGHRIGFRASPGTRIIQCSLVDPDRIDAMPNRPGNLSQGLIRTVARVHTPGATAAFSIRLSDPLPEGHQWFMHTPDRGWFDFSRERISNGTGDGALISENRSEITIYITDNGPYDGDPAEGVVVDPTGPGTPGVPDLSIDSTELDFDSIAIGEASVQTMVITNAGTGNLDVGSLAIAGRDASEFSITGDDCSGNRLAYSETGTVSIEFLPESLGDKLATLVIPSNDPDAKQVELPLSGTGVEIQQNDILPSGTDDSKGGGGGSGCFVDTLQRPLS